MTKLREYLSDACEEIDAGVFSGDVLYCDDERKELKVYVERWSRAIAALETADTPCLPDNFVVDAESPDMAARPADNTAR